MKTFKSEAVVITKLTERLATAGSQAQVSVHSDSQPANSVERAVIFKAVVALESSEVIVNAMADIGADESIDRAIVYIGSEVEAKEGGEVRYLLFKAKINPYEEY